VNTPCIASIPAIHRGRMPEDLKIATAQFENRSGDKAFNLSVIDQLSARAAQSGADVIAFHECSVTGYTFARRLSKAELWELAEPIPSGPSVAALTEIARRQGIAVLAGLFERGDDGEVYKAQVCVDGQGLLAKHRKIHPFINPHIRPGNEYTVFDLEGWKCGILICYGRVDDWRGKQTLRGVAVDRQGRCLSPRCKSRFQSPLVEPDVRSCRIRLSHMSLKPSLSSRPHDSGVVGRGRASHRDARRSTGGIPCLAYPVVASAIAADAARCIS
jgi:hypothetical protein